MSNDAASDSLGAYTYKSSLTAFFDSQPGLDKSWSRVLPDIAGTPGSPEGFAYLGLAGLLITPFSLVGIWMVAKKSPSALGLAALFSLLLLSLALSPTVAFASREIFSYEVPELLDPIYSTFRASGRFIWPIAYIVLLLGLYGLDHLQPLRAIPQLILPLMILIQLIDGNAATSDTRERFVENSYRQALQDPLWNVLGAKYKHLVVIPPLNNDPNWIDFALFADKWNMSTNSAYIARVDHDKMFTLGELLQSKAEALSFREDSLYVLTNYPPNPLSVTLPGLSRSDAINGAEIFDIDGFVVIAPKG
jgi:hypothetical protein